METMETMEKMEKMEKIIEQLLHEQKLLREEMNEMKIYTNYYIKKDVVKFLKCHCIPNVCFEDWYKQFSIDDSYLHIVFEKDLTEGVKKCINDRIIVEGIHSLPIRSFKEKPGTLYIYSNEIGWEICSSSQFSSWIEFLLHCFIKEFTLYEETNEFEDDLGYTYFLKISNTKMKKEKQNTEIKNFLLSLISVTLDSCFVKS